MIQSVYIDTNFLIATFELESPEAAWGWSVLDALNAGAFVGVTSELTIAELLPKPIANADVELERTYLELLDGPLFNVVPISRPILVQAARFRASDRTLRLPDAIHLATAIAEACACFLTDDLRLNLPTGIRRVRLTATVLDEIERLRP